MQRSMLTWATLATILLAGESLTASENTEQLRVATFLADVTPPIGSPLCNGGVKPARSIVSPLTGRGIVLLGAGDPIVLCAMDWVGIGNESHDMFRQAIADAVGTSVDRVTVHTLHQHDTPGSDFATERLLVEQDLPGVFSNAEFDRKTFERVAAAAKDCLKDAEPVTEIGYGSAEVKKVASNRRILGPDGRVAIVRYSSSRNPKAQAAPEGVIDPMVHMLSFWNGEQPVAVLTWYATHPQSYYGQGDVNWDFVGMARESREEALSGVRHVHFAGAGGNVGAGKYNDGSPEMRPILAERLAEGMERAWEQQKKVSVTADGVRWKVVPVPLPVRDTLQEENLLGVLKDRKRSPRDRVRAARDLVFLRRMNDGVEIPLSCLTVGPAHVLHMPGELFVEYELAAQKMRPDEFVAMAAYGDYGPGYIGTEIAYDQGGYETGVVSRVAPSVEPVLMKALEQLLSEP